MKKKIQKSGGCCTLEAYDNPYTAPFIVGVYLKEEKALAAAVKYKERWKRWEREDESFLDGKRKLPAIPKHPYEHWMVVPRVLVG